MKPRRRQSNIAHPPKTFVECFGLCLLGAFLLAPIFLLPRMGWRVFPDYGMAPKWIAVLGVVLLHTPIYHMLLARRKEPFAFIVVFALAGLGLTLNLAAGRLAGPFGLWPLLMLQLGLWLGFWVATLWVPTAPLPGKCECGYDLRALPEPRCPECGLAFDPHRPDLVN